MKTKRAHSIPLFFSMVSGYAYLFVLFSDWFQMYDEISDISDGSASSFLGSVFSLGSYLALVILLPQLISIFIAAAFATVGFFDGLASCGLVSGISFLFGVLSAPSSSDTVGAVLVFSLLSFAGAIDTIFSNSRKAKRAANASAAPTLSVPSSESSNVSE